ncbi:MAG: aminotransferase class V-fold PLP-dependent enzyme [Pedobacter sp.]|nr:MAG: aminotransferase class V-fold PLP-dependent enzyme [Pedobacter sp.]
MTFTEQYPLLNTSTYLNTASSGIISRNQLEWRSAHDLDYFNLGSGFRITQADFLQEVKVNVAQFFNASVRNTFLVPSFSFGFNTFLEGLSPEQRFLLLNEDYPSVNYAIESRGHTCGYLDIESDLEQRIVDKIKEFKPTVFAFSLVQYISGVKLDLGFIKELKQLFPELMIVADGTQFCGTEVFDFEKSGLDVLISSGYKWMLAGYGNGFVMLKDTVEIRLFAHSSGIAAPREPFLQGKGRLSVFFEPGHLDTLAFGTLNQSIVDFNKLGMDFVTEQNRLLGAKAKHAFEERGLLTKVVASRKVHSTIFNLKLDTAQYDKLIEQQIICLPRGAGVRLAFHFYNTETDLNKLLEGLDKE